MRKRIDWIWLTFKYWTQGDMWDDAKINATIIVYGFRKVMK